MGLAKYTYNRSTSGGEIITHLINASDAAGLHFDGAAGFIDIATVPDLGTKLSFEFIIQAHNWGVGTEYIFDFGTSGRTLLYNNGNNLALEIGGASGLDLGVDVLGDGKVHHLVLAIDGTSLKVYDNANEVASKTIALPTIDAAVDGVLGARFNSSTTYCFNGTFYRARFWNKTLSQAEVTASYENATVPFADQYSSTASPLMAGTLTSGKLYRINAYVSGDDFTNLGGTNVTGNEFVTTGTTPTTWSNGSSLIQIGCTADFDLAFSNPTQSLMVQDRANIADGTSSATGVVQVTPIEQLNSKALSVGNSQATPADGEIYVSGPTITVDSTANASVVIDKASTAKRANVRYKTAGVDNWFAGLPDADQITGGNQYFIGQSDTGENAAVMIEHGAGAGSGTVGAVRIDSAGNVQVGGDVISTAATGRFRKSNITGRALLTGGTAGGTTDGAYVIAEGFDYGGTGAGGNIALVTTTGTNHDITMYTNGALRATVSDTGLAVTGAVTTTGNVGVGGTPVSAASVARFLYVGDTSSAGIVLDDTNSTPWDIYNVQGDLYFSPNGGASTLTITGSTGLATFSAGIAFSGQTESTTGTPAASSVLNHYETGTWTAVLKEGTTAITLSSDGMVYVRVGKTVTVAGYFTINDASIGSGALSIEGLPFAMNNTPPDARNWANFNVQDQHDDGFNSGGAPVMAYANYGASIVHLTKNAYGGAGAVALIGSEVQDTQQIRLSGTYIAA